MMMTVVIVVLLNRYYIFTVMNLIMTMMPITITRVVGRVVIVSFMTPLAIRIWYASILSGT